MAKSNLDIIIGLTDQASGPLGKLTGSLGGVAKSLGTLGLIAGGAAIAAIAGIGAVALKAGLQLDEAFDTIRIKTGATGEILEGLKQDFREVFTSVPTDAGTASAAISELHARLGLMGEPLVEVTKNLTEMTRMLGGDAATNAGLFGRVMGDWSISTEDASITLDKLFAASQATGVGVESLMGKVVQFGAPMRLMGFELNDAIALFAKWEKEGVNAELVMGSLRIAAGEFARAGVPLREGLLETFESIKNNTDASEALADAMDIFGARAGPDMAAAIREGRFEFEELLTVLGESEGAIMNASKDTQDFGEKFILLKNKVTVALEPLGITIMDLITNISDALLPAVDNLIPIFQGLSEKITPVIEQIGYLIAAIIDAGIGSSEAHEVLVNLFGEDMATKIQNIIENVTSLYEIVRLLITGDFRGGIFGMFEDDEFIGKLFDIRQAFIDFKDTVIEFVKEHAEELKGALIAIGAVLAVAAIVSGILGIVGAVTALASPLGLLVIAVGLLGAAWAGNWGGIRDVLTEIWENKLKPALTDLWDWLSEVIPPAIESLSKFWTETLQPALAQVGDFIVQRILPVLGDMVAWLIENIPKAIQTASDFWTNTLQPALNDVWTFIETKILPIFSDVWDWLQTNIPKAIETVKTFWETKLLPALNSVWEFIDTYIVPIFESVGEILDIALTLAVEAMAGLWENVLQPALETVWKFIQDNVVPILEDLRDFIVEHIGPKVQWFTDNVLSPLGAVLIDSVKQGLEWVNERLQEFKTALENLTLPEWLRRKSPSPFEMVFIGASEAIQELVEDWLPKLVEKIKSVEKTAWGMAEALLETASQFGGIASGFVPFFTRDVLDPIQREIDVWQERIDATGGTLEDMFDQLAEQGLDMTGQLENAFQTMDIGRLRQLMTMLRSLPPGLIAGVDPDLTQRAATNLEYIIGLIHERNVLEADFAAEQERILALQRQQQDLAFLQQQLELLDLIRELQLTDPLLDPDAILGGMQLGLQADMSGVLEAMTRAMQELIAAAETQLGIASPSAVFRRLGNFIMEGLASGIAGARLQPQLAFAGSVPGMLGAGAAAIPSPHYNLTIVSNARTEDVLSSFELMKALEH